MTPRVVLMDYGAGNLLSVARAFRHLGADVVLADNPASAKSSDRMVLPGVGAFGACLEAMRQKGLDEPVLRHIEADRPFLGICVGMQLLFEGSDEFGVGAGLGVLPGWVRIIPSRDADGRARKIPHIGWNGLVPSSDGQVWSEGLLKGLHAGESVYFVHSFAAQSVHAEHRLAECEYEGLRLQAAVRRGNLFGCQFHPEKSGPVGLRILNNFLNL